MLHTAYSENTLCVGLARVGADDQQVRVNSILHDHGPPLPLR